MLYQLAINIFKSYHGFVNELMLLTILVQFLAILSLGYLEIVCEGLDLNLALNLYKDVGPLSYNQNFSVHCLLKLCCWLMRTLENLVYKDQHFYSGHFAHFTVKANMKILFLDQFAHFALETNEKTFTEHRSP